MSFSSKLHGYGEEINMFQQGCYYKTISLTKQQIPKQLNDGFAAGKVRNTTRFY